MTNPFADDADLVACARIVERGDPDRFAAVMAVPVPARARLFPIYAFNVEVSRAPWVTEEPMIAEMRLQWWQDVLEEIADGQAVRRHEVATPLARVLDAEGAASLMDLVTARQWDVYKDAHADTAALDAYLDRTGGALLAVAARALGGGDARAARLLGGAAGLAAYLQAVPTLEAMGRVPLVDGRPEAVADLARRWLSKIDEARAQRQTLAPAARPALIAGALARPLLRRAVAQPGVVGQGGLALSEGQRRWRRLWVGATGLF